MQTNSVQNLHHSKNNTHKHQPEDKKLTFSEKTKQDIGNELPTNGRFLGAPKVAICFDSTPPFLKIKGEEA